MPLMLTVSLYFIKSFTYNNRQCLTFNETSSDFIYETISCIDMWDCHTYIFFDK